MGIEITGWGKCLPPTILKNEDFETYMDTSNEWIVSRTGEIGRASCRERV